MYLLVRNEQDAKAIFGNKDYIEYIDMSIENFKPTNLDVDYIIHAASPTKSKFFIEKAVETLDTAVIGTKNVLDFSKINRVKSGKRLKIAILTSEGKTLVISDVKVKQKRVIFKTSNDIDVINGTFKFLDNKLEIIPKNSEKVEIIFKTMVQISTIL